MHDDVGGQEQERGARRMRVLLVSQYFYPEVGATQTRMMEFARALSDAGHEVDVLTEFPNHPTGVIPGRYRGRWVEIDRTFPFRIIRVWVCTAPTKTFSRRLLFYGSFFAMALLASVRLPAHYDVVAATSPPLPAALAGQLIARLKRAVFVLDVRDLWPLAAGALQELSSPRLYRWAERLEQHLYDRAARITVTTRAFLSYISARLREDHSKVVHVPNGTIAEIFNPERGDNGVRQRLELENQFVVTYAGLHGVAQDLATVLDAADQLHDSRVRFIFVGDGPMKAALMRDARVRGLTNVIFCDQVALEESAFYLNASDAVLVTLVADPIFRMFVPSKLFDAMACAIPVLLSVDGEARAVLEDASAGLFVPPGNAGALAAAILQLERDAAGRTSMGHRGRQFVVRNYLRRDQARRFTEIVSDAVPRGHRQGAEPAASTSR